MKQYPCGVMGMTRQGDRSLMIWEKKDAGAQEIHRMDWKNGSTHVVVSTMTDAGTYQFNNWDNSQSGEPSQWEEIDRIPAGDALSADTVMQQLARDRFGVTEII